MIPEQAPPIRVMLVEDHETVRAGLRLLVDAEHDMQVVGEAADGEAVVDAAAALSPDVVILDLTMPKVGGLAAAKTLKASFPDVRIVALTRHSDYAFVQQLLMLGASAYVLKQSASAELLKGIRIAAAGGRYVDPGVASDPLDNLQHHATTPVPTRRETEVLRLMAAGHSNKDIAARLGISVKTVEVHKSNAMHKLALKGRADIVRYAILHGWLRDP